MNTSKGIAWLSAMIVALTLVAAGVACSIRMGQPISIYHSPWAGATGLWAGALPL